MSGYFLRYQGDWTKDSVSIILSASRAAKTKYFYLQELGYFETNAAFFTERESLDSFLLLHTKSGSGLLTYQGKTHHLQCGNTFLINCNEHQLYQHTGNVPWTFSWMHFNGLSSLAYYDDFMQINGGPVICLSDHWLATNLDELIRSNQRRNMASEAVNSLKIAEMLTHLIMSGQQKNQVTVNNEPPGYLREMVRYLDRHYREKITLDQLSALFSLNKYYLHKKFRQQFGIPINQYIVNCKINKAKELLRYSSLSVQEIAEHVGVSNTSYFIRMFKKHENTTPLSYQYAWKNLH